MKFIELQTDAEAQANFGKNSVNLVEHMRRRRMKNRKPASIRDMIKARGLICPRVLTPDDVLKALSLEGISIATWAKLNGVSMQAAYDVLRGRSLGRFGESHRAAVLLGLKEGVIDESHRAHEAGSAA